MGAKNPNKHSGIYNIEEEAYDLSMINKNVIEEGDDAGGAIMKKLYRIHSRYVLEINDNFAADMSA